MLALYNGILQRMRNVIKNFSPYIKKKLREYKANSY